MGKIICPKSSSILCEEAGLAVYTKVHISDLTPCLVKCTKTGGGGKEGYERCIRRWAKVTNMEIAAKCF
jgi:hypothetical protein